MQIRFAHKALCAGAVAALAGSAIAQTSRPYDGFANNLGSPEWGSVNAPLVRLAPPQYADGVWAPAGATRPNPRDISNAVATQGRTPIWSSRALTSLTVFWGQFVDHDMGLTEPPKAGVVMMPVAVPAGDPTFGPAGVTLIPFMRSRTDALTGTGPDNPTEQPNEITAFLDASMVYGHTPERVDALRAFTGGELIKGEGDLMPWNFMEIGMANPLGATNLELFAAGDVRANENPALAALHTVFSREHNRQAALITASDPMLSDEAVFQAARKHVMALIQQITAYEYVPALLGRELPAYAGYNASVNPGVANEFAHAAFRFGHTTVNPQLPRYDSGWRVSPEGPLDLFDAFFNTGDIAEFGVDSIIRGQAFQAMQEVDTKIVDDLRNMLFPAGSGGLDLASVNIQRGRDHGLASYNDVREAIGLARVTSFAEITSDPGLGATLATLYGSVDDMDLWVAGLAEDRVSGGSLGPTFTEILLDQFARTRDGDRYWFENPASPDALSAAEIDEIRSTTLADVIRRNSGAIEIHDNVFFLSADTNADGNLDIFDVIEYLNFFENRDPRADLTGDGSFDFFDFRVFLGAFSRFS
ncbi:MAG: peroxidase family protein [Planctomycetota bacterium]